MAKEKNIFEAAANQLGKKSLNTKEKDTPSRPIPQKRPPVMDEETQNMLGVIKNMREDLESKVNYIESNCEKLGSSVQGFVNLKKKLSPAELNALEKTKELLGSKVWKSIGLPETLSKSMNTSPAETTEQKNTNRKSKTLGARKKWLPVR